MKGRFKKHQHPPFFLSKFSTMLPPPGPPADMEDEIFFQKSATLVVSGIEIELQPTWPIFEKCSH
jgi:hypothetical protein